MTRLDKDRILAELRAEDVAAHLGIAGIGDQRWRGRWMRSRRCGQTDHPGEAFGLARDGHWHCHACDQGGDLITLIAVSEGLDQQRDFQKVLEIAAEIAGVSDEPPDFDAEPRKPRPRPPLPPEIPFPDRLARACKRAAATWDSLWPSDLVDLPQSYLRTRGLDPAAVLAREELRSTPMRLNARVREAIEKGEAGPDAATLWATFGVKAGLSMVVPVRSAETGELVDLRARRVDPSPGRPKIVGMVGGVTTAPAQRASVRRLIGCYGFPHAVESDHVIIVEGAMDYLTALAHWPNCQVLGAVEAGSFALVAGHAARELARRDGESRITIVEQNDPPRTLKDGRVVAGAADAATNEEPNAALKVALRHLGAARVQHLPISGGKDLNDLVAAGANVDSLIRMALSP